MIKPRILLIRDKEGDSKQQKESPTKVVEYYEKHFELQDGMDNDSGEECPMCVQTAEPYAVQYHQMM